MDVECLTITTLISLPPFYPLPHPSLLPLVFTPIFFRKQSLEVFHPPFFPKPKPKPQSQYQHTKRNRGKGRGMVKEKRKRTHRSKSIKKPRLLIRLIAKRMRRPRRHNHIVACARIDDLGFETWGGGNVEAHCAFGY